MAVKNGVRSLRARIRRTINVMVVIAIYIVASVGCLVTVMIYKTQMNQIVSSELQGCSESLEAWFNEKVTVTEFIASEIISRGYLSDNQKCLEFLVDSSARDEQVFDTYIGFADKHCLFAGGWEPNPGEYDPTTRGWYIDAVAADGAIVTDPYTDAQTGRQVITCSVKLESDGKIVGVLAQDIFIDEIANVVNSLHIDENGYALLTTADGSIIVHENQEYLPSVDADGNDISVNLSDVMTGYSSELSDKVVNFTDYNSEKIKYAEVILDLTGWKLGYSLNSWEYEVNIVKVIMLFLGLTAIFGIVLSLLVAFLLRKAFRPLNEVAENARRVSDGHLDVWFNYEYNDEIGAVCRTIENNNRVVKNYIDDISKRLDGISHGDFSVQSDVEYIGDYTSLKTSLDNISDSLGRVFNGIESASAAVFGGAGGVSNGASQLAESVSNQTALINEIVSGMNIVSDKIENNVSRTDEARKVAKRTADVVDTSSSQMQQLLEAMNEISDSSEKIKNIIGTIEDIAFQTNILALNASVEAARAGAAGKGFAVVADEVRNLAGKSAKASEQTARLIEQSAEAVNKGMKLAEETSESLENVVTQTGQIDGIIVKINEESHEQRACVDEVNSKITLVADYVSSAAANAEESAAASEELNSQASSLKYMLDEFKA